MNDHTQLCLVCDQVLISCGVPREQGLTSRTAIETPLAVNGFNNQALRVSSDKQQLSQSNYGTDITVPTLQKQPQSTGTYAEGLDGNGMAGPSIAPKKRRKPWTKEEDMELIAGVQKFGEGNWANILKGDFKHNRTASQLSQVLFRMTRCSSLLSLRFLTAWLFVYR